MKFETIEELKESLTNREVDEDHVETAATTLGLKGFKESDSLLGISSPQLQQVGFEIPLAVSLSDEFKPRQPPQFSNFLSEDAKKGLEEMAADHLHEWQTTVLSKACGSDMQDLLSTLEPPERGAKWETKPNFLTVTIGKFDWLNCDEDHEENRKAHMQHLDEKLTTPTQIHSHVESVISSQD